MMLVLFMLMMLVLGGSQACSGNCSLSTNNTSKDWCYTARIHSTVLQGLPFGGVPTVLALDFMFFLVRNSFVDTCSRLECLITPIVFIHSLFVRHCK